MLLRRQGQTATGMPADLSRHERIGILGGTFDPIHVGHLVAAQAVYESLELDRVFLIPTGLPPHKAGDSVAPASLRLRMVRAAVEGDSRFEVSDLELRRTGPSYTVDTLRSLTEAHPSTAFFLILGADQWAGFGGWRDPGTIASQATLVVMTRGGEDPRTVDPGLPPDPTGGVGVSPLPVAVPRIDLSSTFIRERIQSGRSVRYMVPESVHRILEASRLYL